MINPESCYRKLLCDIHEQWGHELSHNPVQDFTRALTIREKETGTMHTVPNKLLPSCLNVTLNAATLRHNCAIMIGY